MIIAPIRSFVESLPLPAVLPAWVRPWLHAVALPLLLVLAYAVVSRILPFLVGKSHRQGVRSLVGRTREVVQLILLTLGLRPELRRIFPEPLATTMDDRVLPLVLVVAVAVLAYRVVGSLFVQLRRHFDTSGADNLQARRATTQIIILERVVGFVVVLIGIATGLMTIPEVRQYGTSLLASAGVAGLVLGFAAQQTIANVLAGIQIAITQPVRIEDAVVIDGEWGWVEEITLTYVVVRLWDKRRQVVPISYLLQKPFQNWTRSNSSIIGSVTLHVDFTLDVAAVRAEQSRLLAGNSLWDGQVDVVQVVDTTERTMVIRSLVSAESSPTAWDLRCSIREALIDWLRRTYPESLPRERLRVKGSIQA